MNSIVLDATAVALVYFMRSVTETPTLRTTSGAEPLSKPRDLLHTLEISLCSEYLTTQERTDIFWFAMLGMGSRVSCLLIKDSTKDPSP